VVGHANWLLLFDDCIFMLLLVGVGEHLQHMRNQVRSRAALLPFEIGVHREIVT